ncbi:hypothetical protein F4810DRAFT_678936 [Camillea tinctor]|nr:hypothetical protein F4810DRAFT_678936 [Camillea tinctor]
MPPKASNPNLNPNAGTPTVPDSDRILGVAWHVNGEDWFQCHEYHYKKKARCDAIFKNKAHSISSHATKIHVHDSQYQLDADKSKDYRCTKCPRVTSGFHAYVKHWRDKHHQDYKRTTLKHLRTHNR